MYGLLICAAVLVLADALASEIKQWFVRFSLLFLSAQCAGMWLWMKINTAELYSRCSPHASMSSAFPPSHWALRCRVAGGSGSTMIAMVGKLVASRDLELSQYMCACRHDPPELHSGGFISLSSYQKCADFLLFLMLHSLFMAYNAWRRPRDSIFLSVAPTREQLYRHLHAITEEPTASALAEDDPIRDGGAQSGHGDAQLGRVESSDLLRIGSAVC